MTGRRLASLAALMHALSRAVTLEHVYDAALDTLQSVLGVERASILLFDAKDFMAFVAWRGISDRYRSAVNGHTPWRPDSADPKPIAVADVREDESLAGYSAVFAAENIRALAFIPLTYRNRVIGKFMLYWSEPHELTTDETELAQTIAAQIAFGVARVRAEQDLERERERLRGLIKSVPGVVWEAIQEPDGRRHTTYVSPHIETLLGYPVDEWYRNPQFWNEVIVSPEPLRFEPITSDSPTVHRYRMRARDGRLVWTEVRSSYQSENGRNLIRGVTIDITSQREAERREHFLSQASALLASSLDYEMTLPKIAMLAIADVADWCAIDVVDERGDMKRIAESGTAMPDRVVTAPLTAGGRSVGTLSLACADRDLVAELALRIGYAVSTTLLFREAQEANRAKDEFLATLSHELRTPLTATLGWATMLKMGDLSPENFRTAVETIERSIKAQTKLIDEILDVSRIVTGKLQLAVAPVQLAAIIDAAAGTIRPSVAAKDIELRLEFAAGDAVVLGDAARLQQVIWNLLSNSVKFTPKGGSITISIDHPTPDSVRIAVKDTGIGIAPRFLPHVFERFRQADSSTTRAQGGLGLGLSIVKSIVELHGGSVGVSSDGEGLGSTFTITLLESTQRSAAALQNMQPSAAAELDGVSVLLVEDEDDTRTMLTTLLRKSGADVTAVGSAAAAIEVLRDKPATDVVISDIGMPGEDGCMLMMKIRSGAVASCRDIPAIALTAYAREEDRNRILASGFGVHLAKPVDPSEVVRAVRNASVARGRSDRHAQ